MRIAILATMLLGSTVFADSKGLPTKMSQLDVAKFDAAWMHEQAIMEKATMEAQLYEKEIQRICLLYKIDPKQLRITVGIDTTTGEITRKDPPAAPEKPAAKK